MLFFVEDSNPDARIFTLHTLIIQAVNDTVHLVGSPPGRGLRDRAAEASLLQLQPLLTAPLLLFVVHSIDTLLNLLGGCDHNALLLPSPRCGRTDG